MADDMSPANRRRELTIQNTAFGGADVNGPKTALVVRHMRRDRTFQRVRCIRNTVGKRLRPLHRYGDRDHNWFVKPVGTNLVAVGSLWQLGNRLTHRLF